MWKDADIAVVKQVQSSSLNYEFVGRCLQRRRKKQSAASHLAIQNPDEDSLYSFYCRRLWSDAVKNEPHHIPLAAVSVSVTKEVSRPLPISRHIISLNRHLTVIVCHRTRAIQVHVAVTTAPHAALFLRRPVQSCFFLTMANISNQITDIDRTRLNSVFSKVQLILTSLFLIRQKSVLRCLVLLCDFQGRSSNSK